MKLSREFTTSEKVLLVILALIIIGLVYYRFFYVRWQNDILEAHSQKTALQSDLNVAQIKERQLKKMKDELDEIGELTETSVMASYNNSKAEMELLNRILQSAQDYSIKFSNVTRDGDTIRRNFSLSFKAGSFKAAKQILQELSESGYRCLLGDVSYRTELSRLADNETADTVKRVDGVRYAVTITVNADATFYETMYGGTPDAGLPAA